MKVLDGFLHKRKLSAGQLAASNGILLPLRYGEVRGQVRLQMGSEGRERQPLKRIPLHWGYYAPVKKKMQLGERSLITAHIVTGMLFLWLLGSG